MVPPVVNSSSTRTMVPAVISCRDDPFPMKLHRMLEGAEKLGLNEIISWNADGRSFTIFQPHVLACTIMQIYFRGQTKYESFHRQLNIYEFKREKNGRARGVCKYQGVQLLLRSLPLGIHPTNCSSVSTRLARVFRKR
jgi:hypothetical protein